MGSRSAGVGRRVRGPLRRRAGPAPTATCSRPARDGEVDVIYVATPHPQHHDLALAAIEGGTPAAGREGVHRHARRGAGGGRRRPRGAGLLHGGDVDPLPAGRRPRPRADRRRRDRRASLLVQADFGAQRDFDPKSRLFDLALGGGVRARPRRLPDLARPALPRPSRPRSPPPGRRTPTAPTPRPRSTCVRRRAGRRADLLARQPRRRCGPSSWARAGRSSWSRRSTTPAGSSYAATAQEPETIERRPTGRGYVHQAEEVQRCLAAGLTESPVMPLADTLDVQWVLEETLDQLGHHDGRGATSSCSNGVSLSSRRRRPRRGWRRRARRRPGGRWCRRSESRTCPGGASR